MRISNKLRLHNDGETEPRERSRCCHSIAIFLLFLLIIVDTSLLSVVGYLIVDQLKGEVGVRASAARDKIAYSGIAADTSSSKSKHTATVGHGISETRKTSLLILGTSICKVTWTDSRLMRDED